MSIPKIRVPSWLEIRVHPCSPSNTISPISVQSGSRLPAHSHTTLLGTDRLVNVCPRREPMGDIVGQGGRGAYATDVTGVGPQPRSSGQTNAWSAPEGNTLGK